MPRPNVSSEICSFLLNPPASGAHGTTRPARDAGVVSAASVSEAFTSLNEGREQALQVYRGVFQAEVLFGEKASQNGPRFIVRADFERATTRSIALFRSWMNATHAGQASMCSRIRSQLSGSACRPGTRKGQRDLAALRGRLHCLSAPRLRCGPLKQLRHLLAHEQSSPMAAAPVRCQDGSKESSPPRSVSSSSHVVEHQNDSVLRRQSQHSVVQHAMTLPAECLIFRLAAGRPAAERPARFRPVTTDRVRPFSDRSSSGASASTDSSLRCTAMPTAPADPRALPNAAAP